MRIFYYENLLLIEQCYPALFIQFLSIWRIFSVHCSWNINYIYICESKAKKVEIIRKKSTLNTRDTIIV